MTAFLSGLRFKILLIVSTTVMLVLGAISYLYADRLQQEYIKGMGQRAAGLTERMVADINTLALNSNNLNWVLSLQSIAATQLYEQETRRGVRHVAVFDATGKQLAHNDIGQRGQGASDPQLIAALNLRQPMAVAVGSVYHNLIPVENDAKQYLGTIDVGIDGAEIRATIASQLRQVVVLSLCFMALGVAIIYSLLNALLLKPITLLKNATDAVAAGRLDVDIPRGKADEMGDLTRGIVRMRDAIAQQIHELENYQQTLEQKVIDRTRDMQRAKELAEAASAAKGQFLANMSHELRTPMNAILGMLQLMQRTALSTRQEDYVGKTTSAAKSLLGILNDILDFSKIEAGKMELEVLPFRLDQLMRELSVILSANVADKDVEILFQVAPGVPTALKGDSMRLQQVLINLCGNAIKFTRQGEVVVGIELVALTAQQADIRFTVRDTGIGIAADKLAYIFEGFSQAEGSTTRRFGGTGLGLAISQRFVALMGGDLQVHSEEGKGSTFDFTLPLLLDRAGATPVVEAVPPSAPLRVLIVDDNALSREILSAMARSFGWQVELAASGEEGLNTLAASIQRDEPFNVVLVDWRMPGMDGWAVCEHIRRQAMAHMPVLIMVTAHGREVLSQRSAEQHPMLDGFLVKPVTASMVYDAVVDAQAAHHGGELGHDRVKSVLTGRARLTGVRILLVEDNVTNQQVAYELLTGEGADVTIAHDGLQGVQTVQKAPTSFDVVLMDVQMPVIDGYAASREIRGRLGLHSLPIIAMTANAMHGDRELCLSAGMNDHVGKPFDLDELVATILGHLVATKVAQGAPEPSPEAEVPPTPALLDAQRALLRMGGNQTVLHSAMKLALSELQGLAGLLRQSHQAGAQDTMRALHTLKGTMGTVGAERLAQELAQQERAARDNSDGLDVEKMIADLAPVAAQTLHALLQHLQAHSEVAPTAIPAKPMTAGQREQALGELASLLHGNNMQAITLCETLQEEFARTDHGTWHALQDAVRALDFAQALVHCSLLQDATR